MVATENGTIIVTPSGDITNFKSPVAYTVYAVVKGFGNAPSINKSFLTALNGPGTQGTYAVQKSDFPDGGKYYSWVKCVDGSGNVRLSRVSVITIDDAP